MSIERRENLRLVDWTRCFARLCCKGERIGSCRTKNDGDTWMEPIPKKSPPPTSPPPTSPPQTSPPQTSPPPTSNGCYGDGGERRKPSRARRPKPWDDPQDNDDKAVNMGAKSVTWSVVLENLDEMKLKDLEDLDSTAHDRKVQASVNSFNIDPRAAFGESSSSLAMTSMRSIFSEDSVMREVREVRESISAAAGQNQPNNHLSISNLSFCRNDSVINLQFKDDGSESGQWSQFSESSNGSANSDDGTKTTLTTVTARTEDSDDADEKGENPADEYALETGLKKIRRAEEAGGAAALAVVEEGEELEGGGEPETRSKKILWLDEAEGSEGPHRAFV